MSRCILGINNGPRIQTNEKPLSAVKVNEHNAIITQSPRARQARFACLASRLFALSYQGVLPAKNPHVRPLWE
jgi:hypothetical protein